MPSPSPIGDRPTPTQIADDLRLAITSGEMQAGEKITKVDHAKAYGVPVATINAALRILKDQGFVGTRHPGGDFVRAGATSSLGAMRRLLVEASELLAGYETRGRRPAPGAVAAWRERARAAGAEV